MWSEVPVNNVITVTVSDGLHNLTHIVAVHNIKKMSNL